MRTLTSSGSPTHVAAGHRSGIVPAFLVALALHALVLVAVMVHRLAPPTPPGEQRVSVDLSPVMAEAETQAPAERQMSQAAPPEVKPVDEPTEEAVRPPPPAEMAEVKPEEAEARTPPMQALVEPPPDVQPVEPPQGTRPTEPEDQVITSTAEMAEPAATPPPEVTKVLEEKAAEPPKPEPAKPEPAKPEPAKPKPDLAKLKAEREAKLRRIREEETRAERLEAIREAKVKAAREAKARQAKAQQGAEARDSAAASRRSATGRAAAGNDPSAMQQWFGSIKAAIHGRMNPAAAVGTAGGTAVVRFTVLRSGQVVGAGLARSSGVGQIDSAALSAVRGGLPPAPAGVTIASQPITIPLNYRVR